MSVTGLWCPTEAREIPLDEAPNHFESVPLNRDGTEEGFMPAEFVQAVVDGCNDPRRGGQHLSPSKLDSNSTCRRQTLLERNYGYALNPLDLWDAEEGTLYHDMATVKGAKVKGWFRNMLLPTQEHLALGIEGVVADERGVPHWELAPGILLNGEFDRLREDGKVLVDYKTTKYPWTPKPDGKPRDYGPKSIPGWSLQLNAYRHMVEAIMDNPNPVEQMWVWRMYRGCRRREFAFKKFAIPFLSKEELVAKIQDHALSSHEMLAKAVELRGDEIFNVIGQNPELDAHVKACPMDGEKMFNGKKCGMYCSVQPLCYSLQGKVTF